MACKPIVCIFRGMLAGADDRIFLHALFLGVVRFLCVVTVVFAVAIAKLALHFFYMLYNVHFAPFLICMAYECYVINLFACSHFGFVCTFACLPYFLQCLRALLVCFFGQIGQVCTFLHVCRFWPAQLVRLSWFFCRCALRLDYFKAKNNQYFAFCVPFVFVTTILLFFCHFLSFNFCNKKSNVVHVYQLLAFAYFFDLIINICNIIPYLCINQS